MSLPQVIDISVSFADTPFTQRLDGRLWLLARYLATIMIVRDWCTIFNFLLSRGLFIASVLFYYEKWSFPSPGNPRCETRLVSKVSHIGPPSEIRN